MGNRNHQQRNLLQLKVLQMRQYLDLLDDVLSAPIRGDRTGIGTHSVFGRQLRFTNLAETFPLVTTKKMFMRGIFHELKWMLMGETNIKYLVDNGVSIWTDWPLKHYNQQMGMLRQVPTITKTGSQIATKEEFEDAIRSDLGFAQMWGDCGPVYGYQWRKWPVCKLIKNEAKTFQAGGVVIPANEYDYEDTPIDQIANLLNDLQKSPESRRMIVSAWNVADIPAMIPSGLPPCHLLMQFYTREIPHEARQSITASRNIYPVDSQLSQVGIPERYLDCQVYIRSDERLH